MCLSFKTLGSCVAGHQVAWDLTGYFWKHQVGAADFTDATRKPISNS